MIVVSLFALGACGKKSGNPSGKSISGAGASFPFPLYSLWAYRYQKAKGVQITYQSVGSGAGIAQIKKKTVDFGASDKPLKAAELKKYGLLQFPMAMGGVVPVVNIPGINGESLRLTGDVLAKIFLGEIDKWDHAAIAAINPGVKLPSLAIKVVHRADGSGTTWIFTNYLAKVSGDWKRKVGNGKSVKWPVGVG
ncbi:phosphate ABC transporter substrate-binding protein PstS, partial [Myxococcota bacterium]|nr:phosphate ABC transporter substrate-binding protein PstS [Myxococcota bacterium]